MVRQARELVESQVAEIDQAVQQLEAKMRPYEALAAERDKLLAARRALLGHGPKLTHGTGGNRVTQGQVVDYVRNNPGTSVQQLADALGSTYHAIYNHLNRSRDERFIASDDSKRWYLRDPKSGVNTIEDIEEEQDRGD
jgi:hypothetical protein